ncbi:MAG TPA: DUF427 domain-containing protein [Oceanobacillus sp.]|nr:DUF427 domain-containing protein [Oceanobacillus sp.]
MHYQVKERISGEVIAAGTQDQQVQVFEGNLYFAPEAVNMERLRVTDRIYTCPYKGECFWIDLETENGYFQNVAWVYRNPKPKYEFIKDQIGFYAYETSGTIVDKTAVAQSA